MTVRDKTFSPRRFLGPQGAKGWMGSTTEGAGSGRDSWAVNVTKEQVDRLAEIELTSTSGTSVSPVRASTARRMSGHPLHLADQRRKDIPTPPA